MKTEDISKLEDYATLEGCEIGSYIHQILELRQQSESHGMSDVFSSALDLELSTWLKTFETETTIISEDIVIPKRVLIERTLEWL